MRLETETDAIYLGGMADDHGQTELLGYRGKSAEKSLVLIAPSGSGKFTDHLSWTGLTYRGSIVWNDPKGEAAAVTAQRRKQFGDVFIINPFNLTPDNCAVDMASARFNPLARLSPESSTFDSEIGALAAALILHTGGESSHWADSARNFLTAVIAFICTLPPDDPDRTLVSVNDIIQSRGDQFTATLLQMKDCGLTIARRQAEKFLVKRRPRSLLDTLETASTQLAAFLENKGVQNALSGSDFSWSDLKARNITVYIVMPEAEAKTYFRFTRLMFASAFKSLLASPRKPVLFLLDELATSLGYQALDQVETAFSLGRGYGLRLQAVFQSFPQAEELFGRERAQAILSSAGILQFYRPNDEITAALMCRRAGSRSEIEKVWGVEPEIDHAAKLDRQIAALQGSTHQLPPLPEPHWIPGQRAIDIPLYRPQELYALPPDRTIIFKEGTAHPIEAYRWPYYKIPALNALAAPNPYA